MLASLVLALLAVLCPGQDAERLPAGMRAEMPVPKRAVCRVVYDDTSTVACAWRTRGGDLRMWVTTS